MLATDTYGVKSSDSKETVETEIKSTVGFYIYLIIELSSLVDLLQSV